MTITRADFPITILKQRDFTMNVYIRDANNEAISITGWTGSVQVRENNSPESALILTMTVTVADAALGKLTISGAKADTKVCQSSGYWDLALTNADGKTDSYLQGDVTFSTVPTVVS